MVVLRAMSSESWFEAAAIVVFGPFVGGNCVQSVVGLKVSLRGGVDPDVQVLSVKTLPKCRVQ